MKRLHSGGVCLCLAAAACASLQMTLLVTTLLPLLILLDALLIKLLHTDAAGVALLGGAGFGSVLRLLAVLFLPDTVAAIPASLWFSLCLAGGAAAQSIAENRRILSAGQLAAACGALLLTGFVRELVGAGTLLSTPLIIAPLAGWNHGSSGLLLAGIFLFLCRLNVPVFMPRLLHPVQAAAGLGLITVGVCSIRVALTILFPTLSSTALFLAGTAAVSLTLIIGQASAPDSHLFREAAPAAIPAAAALLIPLPEEPWQLWLPLLFGAVTGIIVLIAFSAASRADRSPVPVSARGVPLTLMTTALFLMALDPLPL